METPPVLLTALLLIPTKLQTLPHVSQLISDFLLPRTIDAAAYLDLQLMVQIYGHCRPWTVDAMNGAADRGRVDILKWLRTNRREGCSTKALNGAAANGHLDAVQWLLKRYQHHCNSGEALQLAAANGHAHVVQVLWERFQDRFALPPALKAAARNNHVAVVMTMIPWVFNPTGESLSIRNALYEAAENGHVETVALLLGESGELDDVTGLMERAATGGHAGVVRMLLGLGTSKDNGRVLVAAAANGRAPIVRLLLPEVGTDSDAVENALGAATMNGHAAVVEVLLLDTTPSRLGSALIKAAMCNQVEIVKLLLETMKKQPWGESLGHDIHCALEAAAVNSNDAIVGLLDEWDLRPVEGHLPAKPDTVLRPGWLYED